MNVMIVSGVHLDHAWTGLGAPFGSALRDWSRQVLALVVEEANRRSANILLISGDLFDRSYALPTTVDYASQMLGTFSGDVLIVPGKSDWINDTSLYSTHEWASNTSICSSLDYQPCAAAPTVWASAWTSPGGSTPWIPNGSGPRVLVRPKMVDDAVLTVPDLVHDPREPGGFALLIDSANPRAPVQQIDLPRQPGSIADVDVSDATDTDALADALEAVLTPGDPLLLRLLGTLAPGVLLPGFGGPDWSLPPEVVLDLDRLSFATPSVEATDQSARAEFLRAMAYANTHELQRHQTTALGLAALHASAQGG
jgi:hypothetical protein